ncbi:MAG: hypothetical protein CMB80_05415 [Flammeovirgaceae bacterium]|jgi:hypothetical protein|nr:hypothetical protein [Flammeovirgaceae bacterium]MAH32755.1 hypothetical protein [Marinobacter sp.]|tara:strand:+ start:304 stop:492 length:189 start_codon:yes stop_codon:yes gene_type:complete
MKWIMNIREEHWEEQKDRLDPRFTYHVGDAQPGTYTPEELKLWGMIGIYKKPIEENNLPDQN